MSELDDTIKLSNTVLDRVNADPDDDLAMLSRQFLRGREVIERLRATLAEIERVTWTEGEAYQLKLMKCRKIASRANE